tara:strand:- start:2081 stop:2812 length:732 start_codon:yes stop_codon:yes gene_type:complete
MTKLNVPFYASTNNKHLECLEVFVHTFNHYIPEQELRILGYDEPSYDLPDNCKFISMGEQGDVSEWSTDLRKYFLNSNDDYFIYGTEDVFFYETPKIDYINYLLERMRDNFVGRIQLTDGEEEHDGTLEINTCYDVKLIENIIGNPWGDFKLFELIASEYVINTQYSLWNKEYFLKYMIDGMTPWQFEIEGSKRASHDSKYDVWMLDGSIPIRKKEGYGAGGWEHVDYWVDVLSDELRERVLR